MATMIFCSSIASESQRIYRDNLGVYHINSYIIHSIRVSNDGKNVRKKHLRNGWAFLLESLDRWSL